MTTSVKNIVKSISASVLANGVNMMFSVLLVLVVPKAVGVVEYSYWQLYTFYASYVGFFHFGWADGIYLKFGGKNYDDLDEKYFNTQFWLLFFMEVIIAIAMVGLASICISDSNKTFIISMIGVCCILQLPRVLLQYLMQTTNRITEYAKNQILEKVIYAITVISLLIVGIRKYEILIFADLLSKLVTLLCLMYLCRNIVFRKITGVWQGIKAAAQNISIGSKLLLSNIASMLITGVVRNAVENCWSVEVFGRVSLTMTVSNLLMVFIGAVSIVMYPLLKNLSEKTMIVLYSNLRCMLMVPVLGMLLCYYPAKCILSAWLPQYAESLRYMALLFPMCVFESKMSMLITTYLKALRKERSIMKVNIMSMSITLMFTILFSYILHHLTLSIALLTFALALRSILGEITLAKSLKVIVYKDIIWEVTLAIVFIMSSWILNSWISTVIYAVVYVCYLIYKKNDIKLAVKQAKNYIGDVQ